MPTATGYTLTTTTTAPFAAALERVRAELNEEGFGVLCEIDVQATLREKLGVEQEPYTILGACNPSLAHEALVRRTRARHAPALQRRRLRAGRRDAHLGDRRRPDALDRRQRRACPSRGKGAGEARCGSRASRQQPLVQQQSHVSPRQFSGLSEASRMRRETSRVSFLMCPFCVRELLTKSTMQSARSMRRSFPILGLSGTEQCSASSDRQGEVAAAECRQTG